MTVIASQFLGQFPMGGKVLLTVQATVAATGVAVDADSAPVFTVYDPEEPTDSPIDSANMTELDDQGTLGLYVQEFTLNSEDYVNQHSYVIRVAVTVSGVTNYLLYTFRTGPTPVTMQFVDEDHTWRFEAADQLTAANTIRVLVGFQGLLRMNLDRLLSGTTLEEAVAESVDPTPGLAVTNVTINGADRRSVDMEVDASSPGTYLVLIDFSTVDGQSQPRFGRIDVEAVS